jgi:membrane protease YdiL (CAAX protease family)
MMGPKTILICISATLLGIVAGTYRQASGSLIPAILVHLLFNVGGTLPAWLSELRWFR